MSERLTDRLDALDVILEKANQQYDCCACGGAEGFWPCTLCIADMHYRRPKTNSELVGEFHEAFGVKEPVGATVPDDATIRLRRSLIAEEKREVEDELFAFFDGAGNLANLAKELADLLVVTYGTARTFGIDIDAVFAEVHRSNMSKLGEDGKPVLREDGKVLKSDRYRPADVQSVLDRQPS
jgi:predicted HAD superfamily Cof-like phosphohydrolase